MSTDTTPPEDNSASESYEVDQTAIRQLGDAREKIVEQLSRIIVGQEDVIEEILISLFSRSHCLLEGVPGLAKTLMISTLSRTLDLSFSRIQFTPDLMPADITGTEIIEENKTTGARERRFLEGPIFSNVVLADEINRTPPKTQASMLESMQERMVSAGGNTYELPKPFFVLATQNPLEQEGTYPLPEAQLDRFLLFIKVGYPTASEEWDIARKVTSGDLGEITPVISAEDIISAQKLVQSMPICDQVLGYAHALVRATRPGEPEAPEFINQWVSWGAGPRGVLSLISCAKSRALLYGRYHASVEDVQAIMAPALAHRIAPNYSGMASGITSHRIIEMLLEEISSDQAFEPPQAVTV